MITRKLRFSVLQLTKTVLVNFPLKKTLSENCSWKKRPMRKVLEKYIFLSFDLIGNAYSAGDNFIFLLILSRTRNMFIKKGVLTTWGIAY